MNDSSLPDRDSKSPAEKRVRETSSVSSSSSLDRSVDESAVELYEALEMAQILESKIDLVLTRLAEMDKKNLLKLSPKLRALRTNLECWTIEFKGTKMLFQTPAKLLRKQKMVSTPSTRQ